MSDLEKDLREAVEAHDVWAHSTKNYAQIELHNKLIKAAALIERHRAELLKLVEGERQYRAEFLWPGKDEVERLGYEFANAKTEAYRKEVWAALRALLSTPPQESKP